MGREGLYGSPREGEYLASCLGTAPPFVKLCYFLANISAIPKKQGVPRTVQLYNVHIPRGTTTIKQKKTMWSMTEDGNG